jgi:hypothetical protein
MYRLTGSHAEVFPFVVGLVLAFVAATSFAQMAPAENEIKGEIGVANKYRVGQITTADVKLDNPELHALFQNEEILRLLQEGRFRESVVAMTEDFLSTPVRPRVNPLNIAEFYGTPVRPRVNPLNIAEFYGTPATARLDPVGALE